MIAIGFFLLCVVALMLVLDSGFGKNTPEWYAMIGVITLTGGVLSIAAGVAMVLWRALP